MRAGAAASVLAMAKTCGVASEPYLVKAVAWCLDLAADKEAGTRDSATDAVKYICTEIVTPSSVPAVMPYLLEALAFAKKWQTKVLALEMVSQLAKNHPEKVQKQMPNIIPAVTPCMNDSKAQVATQAYTTMSDVCKVCGELLLKFIASCSFWVLPCVCSMKFAFAPDLSTGTEGSCAAIRLLS